MIICFVWLLFGGCMFIDGLMNDCWNALFVEIDIFFNVLIE